MSQPRKLAIIIGSKSDFAQCTKGVRYLMKAEENGLIQIITPHPDHKIIVASVHRHKKYLFTEIIPFLIKEKVDAIICGAGWAAHLIGMIDSHLRFDERNDTITVIGVAFSDEKIQRHTDAAVLSISEVPGTQVIFDDIVHVGARGMLYACEFAVEGDFPKITLPDLDKSPHGTFTFEEVLHTMKKK